MKNITRGQDGTNSSDMRNSNMLLILNILRKKSVSRSELARKTGLSRAGVTLLVDELLQNGVLEEGEANRAQQGGRRPIMLRVRADRFYAVGISITRRGCRIGLLNINGELIVKELVELSRETPVAVLLDQIAKQVREMVEGSRVDTACILGVGVSTPGPVDVVNGCTLTLERLAEWSQVPILAELNARLPWHCYLQNSSIARTILEKNYGVGVLYKNFVYMKVADAVGGGVVINDSLYTGIGRYGNEFGHMSIRYDGERCDCGNTGCLTLFAGIPALLGRHHEEGFASWEEVVDAAYQGDRNALHIVQEESGYLAVAIVGLANLLEPEAFILSGDIDYRSDLLLSLIRERVNTTRMMRERHGLEIVGAHITQDTELRGAATIIVEKFYQGEFKL